MSLLEAEAKRPGNPGGTPQALIRDPQLRLQIHAQKQSKILEWLKTETYSSPEILAMVLGLAHRRSVHKFLATMQEQGVIRHAKVPVVGGHQTLWGITEHGQALACDFSKQETPSGRVFEPGRISALRLRHILGLQKMKWQALQAGWAGWKNCDRGVKPQRKGDKRKHRPDAIVIDPSGLVVALELELTFKTVKRYAQEVIQSHAQQMIDERAYQRVLWICPTAEDVQRMENLIRQAWQWLRVKQSYIVHQLDAYKQECGGAVIFRLGTIDNWTQQWPGNKEARTGNLRNFLWAQFKQAIKSYKDLDSQAEEAKAWMPISDHALVLAIRDDFKRALAKQRQ